MKSLPLANKRRPPALIWQAAALIVNRESFSETLRFSSIHLFRATQSKAQFLTRTAQQGFEVLMTHGGCIADHSESLLSLWAMPFIRCDNISFYVGCKETCSITISPVHQKILYLPGSLTLGDSPYQRKAIRGLYYFVKLSAFMCCMCCIL